MVVSLEEIQRVCDEIVEKFHPEKIILFGSYASGTQNEHSDVDILIVMEHERSPMASAINILRAVKPRFGTDLIVHSPQEFAERLSMGDYFLRSVQKTGKVLYESAYH